MPTVYGDFHYASSADITSYSGDTATAAKLNLAEQIIDAYVGVQDKWILDGEAPEGMADSGSTTTLTDSNRNENDGYFVNCYLEIIGGTNIGESRRISAFNNATNKITVDTAFTAAINYTSVYRIRQWAQFPRLEDVYQDEDQTYYFKIPEKVKLAVCAQLEFNEDKGASFSILGGDKYKSERIGNYSYTKGITLSEIESLVAPKAKMYLKGFRNKTGYISGRAWGG